MRKKAEITTQFPALTTSTLVPMQPFILNPPIIETTPMFITSPAEIIREDLVTQTFIPMTSILLPPETFLPPTQAPPTPFVTNRV